MGRGALVATTAGVVSPLLGCDNKSAGAFILKPLQPMSTDNLELADGFSYRILISHKDSIRRDGSLQFGDNNDFITFVASPDNPDKGMLWVNHEYYSPLLVSGFTGDREKTEAELIQEMRAVGGSLLSVFRNKDGEWEIDLDDARNRRIDGFTRIPLVGGDAVAGATEAIGSFGNCAGGLTPWGTVLTCEENTEEYYGRVSFDPAGNRMVDTAVADYGWYRMEQRAPEHYGWVVEVNPQTGEARKLLPLGRFAHECATVRQLPDGRCVVYTGDDHNDEHLYKFISDRPNDLTSGTLYVASLEQGRWLPLAVDADPRLMETFGTQTQLLIRCREAAKLVGATPLDRPEDIEIDPATGSVIVSLTNNKPKGNYFGSLLRLVETDDDPSSLTFTHDIFLTGGPESGFACPDNLAFDRKGNLWMTTDISGSELNSDRYSAFGHNGLFYIPMSGPEAGKPVQIVSAPVEAELTGPWFAPDGKSLFLSVQHPGERSKPGAFSSHWPLGGDAEPKSSVVVISGPAMEALLS